MQLESAIRKGAQLRICEIYESIQGEGLLTGTSSLFIRVSGCNLRCWFCDTPFASWAPEGEWLAIEAILAQVTKSQTTHVVLTGGEPMIFPAVVELAEQIRQAGRHLTIETAGTVWRAAQCDLWSISPKLASSGPKTNFPHLSQNQNQLNSRWQQLHEQRRHCPDVVRQMMTGNYQLKFVVNDPGDAAEVLHYLSELNTYDKARVLLMAQGVTASELDQRAEWLEPWCQSHGFTYCPRLHIYLFGNQRAT